MTNEPEICSYCHERPGEIWLCGEGPICSHDFYELSGLPPDQELTFDANLKLSADLSGYVEHAQEEIERRSEQAPEDGMSVS